MPRLLEDYKKKEMGRKPVVTAQIYTKDMGKGGPPCRGKIFYGTVLWNDPIISCVSREMLTLNVRFGVQEKKKKKKDIWKVCEDRNQSGWKRVTM